VPTFVKDSDQILDEVKPLELPTGALLFTADAVSMYNNIDTEHAIAVISWWLGDLHARGELPFAFPLEAVKSAMETIMRNNVFEWGDLYFLQLLGTAMGTSSAVMWATLYFAYHEVHCLIPNHGDRLFYFKRFIDDIFGVWTGTTTQWKTFCTDVNNFGILRWEIETPTTAVTFLDLSLSITGNKSSQKPPKNQRTYSCIYLHHQPTHKAASKEQSTASSIGTTAIIQTERTTSSTYLSFTATYSTEDGKQPTFGNLLWTQQPRSKREDLAPEHRQH
jgi:hypothetical protein